MQDIAIDLRLVDIRRSFDTVLQDGTSLASNRIGDDGGRNEVIWVEDDHVVRVVHGAVAFVVKITNQVDIRVCRAWTVEP